MSNILGPGLQAFDDAWLDPRVMMGVVVHMYSVFKIVLWFLKSYF